MSTWTTSTSDLRKLLADGDTEKLSWRKTVFGNVDGSNKRFKTFEYRRVTDLTTATSPEGIFINNSAVTVASDFQEVGEFELATAPTEGQTIEATYYVQWFTETELENFLQSASYHLGFTSVDNVPPSLRISALQYGAGDAYSNLALRYTRVMGDHYRVNDLPKEYAQRMAESYRALAKDAYDLAQKLRDDYYTRQGQALQPLFANVWGAAPNPQPKE